MRYPSLPDRNTLNLPGVGKSNTTEPSGSPRMEDVFCALNSTIPAAQQGDRGLGFVIVIESKSIARYLNRYLKWVRMSVNTIPFGAILQEA
jgi:hypothetical protein